MALTGSVVLYIDSPRRVREPLAILLGRIF